MTVGQHLSPTDWNNLAYQLLQSYLSFCQQATFLANAVAPYNAAQLSALTGFSTDDATTLISGANVALALTQLSQVNGTPSGGQAQTASQAQVALGKFGGA